VVVVNREKEGFVVEEELLGGEAVLLINGGGDKEWQMVLMKEGVAVGKAEEAGVVAGDFQ